jgi:hypothetical protein
MILNIGTGTQSIEYYADSEAVEKNEKSCPQKQAVWNEEEFSVAS